ncbi:MAG: sulfite exporter TauE/SafE family protein [Anaerolineae bacterium]|nr:sulfite exporter TauE/SafE family protein [Anaerolineae bacterium]
MDQSILLFIFVGFIAQVIDGALGMAYGVSSTTFLLSLGIPPVAASASVHTAEIFTSGVSGLSHLKLGNVDKELFKRLVIPGVLGGVIGAYFLSFVPGDALKPFIAIYLTVMGLAIIRKAIKMTNGKKGTSPRLFLLGALGGFFDAIGGGGWGPIVTSTLVARGKNPRHAIGSVNLTEFFVTLCEVLAFLTVAGLTHWRIIAGLIIGGVLAAPLAALICKKLQPRVLMIIVGVLIVALAARTMIQTLPPLIESINTDQVQIAVALIIAVAVTFLAPILVWAAVIAGLRRIVQDRLQEKKPEVEQGLEQEIV